MCHFVTAAIGASSNIERLNVIAAKHHRWLELVDNESVRPYLRRNELYYSTTPRKAQCDCGTTLGWAARESHRAPKELDVEAATRKLQRKGWGQTKITRWLEAKQHDQQTWKPPSPESLSSDKLNERWLFLIEDMLSEPSVSSFCLLLHWYSGNLETRLPIHGRQEASLSRAALATMEENVLYVFRK